MKRRGFTLIELLVVIAIIAILAAILFPVFAQAREKARAITCISNEKQIGLGILQYIQDYDEFYPLAEYEQNSAFNGSVCNWAGAYTNWRSEVNPYIKSGDVTNDGYGDKVLRFGVWNCPDFPDQDQYDQYAANHGMFGESACNDGGYLGAPYWNSDNQAQVVLPGDLIIVTEEGSNGGDGNSVKPSPNGSDYGYPAFDPWESNWVGGNHCIYNTCADPASGENLNYIHQDLITGDCDDFYGTNPKPNTWCDGYPRYRHQGSTDVLFADGHAKAMHRGQIDWLKNIYWNFDPTNPVVN